MNKNIFKIIIKTIFSLIFLSISLIIILATLASDLDEMIWSDDESLRYDYENGNYNFIMDELKYFDSSGKKYNDDWKVIEVYKLRYDYDICEKIYDKTLDEEYLDKLDVIKEEIEECIDLIDDEYKKDVAKMFLEEIE